MIRRPPRATLFPSTTLFRPQLLLALCLTRALLPRPVAQLCPGAAQVLTVGGGWCQRGNTVAELVEGAPRLVLAPSRLRRPLGCRLARSGGVAFIGSSLVQRCVRRREALQRGSDLFGARLPLQHRRELCEVGHDALKSLLGLDAALAAFSELRLGGLQTSIRGGHALLGLSQRRGVEMRRRGDRLRAY